ncbi:transmembrane protein 240-like [Anoplopoma fimbria]|uniref:transmembrane protein 240-like n=1 Tax=Anoplopoma fimbria TaxID=229290 RepID=UPI0023EDF4EC|nr:transmembrane protein 240-like [Anoplopoma fimbria]
MNAFFDRVHNFILPLVRGEDGVCACTCGRHQVYHVVTYNGAQSVVDSIENHVLSDIMTWQEMNVIGGLLLGLCISFLLQWLERIWHSRLKYRRENHMNGLGFWSWMPKFSNTTESVRKLHPKLRKDSGNMLHINQDLCHNVMTLEDIN